MKLFIFLDKLPYSNRREPYKAAILYNSSLPSGSSSDEPYSSKSLKSFKSYFVNFSKFLINFLFKLGRGPSIFSFALNSINSPKNFLMYFSTSNFLLFWFPPPSSFTPNSNEILANNN